MVSPGRIFEIGRSVTALSAARSQYGRDTQPQAEAKFEKTSLSTRQCSPPSTHIIGRAKRSTEHVACHFPASAVIALPKNRKIAPRRTDLIFGPPDRQPPLLPPPLAPSPASPRRASHACVRLWRKPLDRQTMKIMQLLHNNPASKMSRGNCAAASQKSGFRDEPQLQQQKRFSGG